MEAVGVCGCRELFSGECRMDRLARTVQAGRRAGGHVGLSFGRRMWTNSLSMLLPILWDSVKIDS